MIEKADLDNIELPENTREREDGEMIIVRDDKGRVQGKVIDIINHVAHLIHKKGYIWFGGDKGIFLQYNYRYYEIIPGGGGNVIDKMSYDILEDLKRYSDSLLNAIRRKIRAEYAILDWCVFNKPEYWKFIKVKNGILIVDEVDFFIPNEKIEEDPRIPKDYKTTIQIPWNYNPEAECPLFLECMETILDGDQEKMNHLMELAGYYLITGNPFKKAGLIYGPRHTGKSTFVRILIQLLGKDATFQMSLKNACKIYNDESFSSADVKDKLLLWKDEVGEKIEPNEMEEFKGFTGGAITLKVNPKHQPRHVVNFTSKFLYDTNDLPEIDMSELSSAEIFIDRWTLAEFNHVFEIEDRDEELETAIVTDINEMEGVLRGIFQALQRLYSRGYFLESDGALELWKEMSDPFYMFFKQNFMKDVDEHVTRERMMDLITTWNNDNEDRPINDEPKGCITKKLRNRGIRDKYLRIGERLKSGKEKGKRKKVFVYAGVCERGLPSEQEPDENEYEFPDLSRGTKGK